MNRRRRLLITTAALDGVGAAIAAVPFIASMRPGARAQALGSPRDADISTLEHGQMLIMAWRSNPVWIMRRTPELLATLNALECILVDPFSKVETQQPAYAGDLYRSIKRDAGSFYRDLYPFGLCPEKEICLRGDFGAESRLAGRFFPTVAWSRIRRGRTRLRERAGADESCGSSLSIQ